MSTSRKNIADIRNEYKWKQLDKEHVSDDPLKQMDNWLQEAITSALYEPTAMTLSTVSPNGRPSSRVVLLKGIYDNGLTFFTNYNSRKGRDIASNPYSSLNFFWPELERQVRVEGIVQKISAEESEEYFQSRPRGSQLGAIVSPQSQVIAGREVLEENKSNLEKKLEGKSIERPSHWGGYILIPEYFEFWQGRPDRLHDRISFTRLENEWKIERLAP